MRIAVINRMFSRTGGGAESYSVALVQQLATKHEIHVFAQETDQPVPGVAYHRVFCLSKKPRWINQLLFAVATWWRTRQGFDVVHSHENTWHGQVQTIHVRPTRFNLFAGRSGGALLLRWRKVLASPRLVTYVLLESARFRAKTGRRIVAASDNLLAECQQAYPCSRSMLSVVTPGTMLPPQALAPSVVRRQLGLPAEGKCLLFVANDYARKGLDAALRALALLPLDNCLAVAGSLRQAPRYRQLAADLGLAQRVHFLGSFNDLSVVYPAADCLVHPTLEDSFAMVVLEAMAHGVPVVVSGPKHCGISQQLVDGLNAMLLDDPRDASVLAQRINTVLTQPELAAKLRQQGLAYARAHSWEHAAGVYESIYERVASRR